MRLHDRLTVKLLVFDQRAWKARVVFEQQEVDVDRREVEAERPVPLREILAAESGHLRLRRFRFASCVHARLFRFEGRALSRISSARSGSTALFASASAFSRTSLDCCSLR